MGPRNENLVILYEPSNTLCCFFFLYLHVGSTFPQAENNEAAEVCGHPREDTKEGKSVEKKREVKGGEKKGKREIYCLNDSSGNPGTPEADVPPCDTGTNVQVASCQPQWGCICLSALKGPRPSLTRGKRPPWGPFVVAEIWYQPGSLGSVNNRN